MIENENFSNIIDPTESDIYKNCNFTWNKELDEENGKPKGIPIFSNNDTPRTFISCNLVNRIPPPNSKIIDCNTNLVDYNKEIDNKKYMICYGIGYFENENWKYSYTKNLEYIEVI